MSDQFDAFLSHNSIDQNIIKQLKESLERYGLHVWLDEDELVPGDNWQPGLEAGIRDSVSAVVCFGPSGTGPWEDEEIQALLSLAVKEKKRVIPVLLPGAPKAPPIPIFLVNRIWIDLRGGLTGDGLDKLVWGITGKKPSINQRRILPYAGLDKFTKEKKEFFFGREKLVDIYFDHIIDINIPLLGIMGGSGTGKSSVVMAGIIPRLEDDNQWLVIQFRPRDNPFLYLVNAINRISKNNDKFYDVEHPLINEYRNHPNLLHEHLAVIQDNLGGRNIVLYIDQFEEVFTLSDQSVQKAFIDCIFHNCQEGSRKANSKIIFTYRTDFHENFVAPYFTHALTKNWIVMLPYMDEKELVEVIIKPAEKLGVTIDPNEAKELASEVKLHRDTLPLLELALTKLWQEQIKGRQKELSLRGVSGSSGFKEIITTYADDVFSSLGEYKGDIARRLFKRLVSIDDPNDPTKDTRNEVRIEECLSDSKLGSREDVKAVINDLRDGRLLVSHEGKIEIVHEVLIRQWTKLQEWISDGRDFYDVLRRVRDARSRQDKDLSPDILVACLRWQEQWNEISVDEKAYIEGCLDRFFEVKISQLVIAAPHALSWILDELYKAPWKDWFLNRVHEGFSAHGNQLSRISRGRYLLALMALRDKSFLQNLSWQLLEMELDEYAVACDQIANHEKDLPN